MNGRLLLGIAAVAAATLLGLSAWLHLLGPSAPVRASKAPAPAHGQGGSIEPAEAAPAGAAAVPVRTVQAQSRRWADELAASGTIAPAQELGVSTELAGARVRELLVHPGDRVRRGQTLAVLEAPSLAADAAGAEAALREATLQWEAAREQLQRARVLHPSGAVSTQLLGELTTAEATAATRLQALHVRVGAEHDRRAALQVRAPVDALVLKREAVVGTITQAGQEMYRLVPGAAMLWRAELPSSALAGIRPGQGATVLTPDGRSLPGRVRGIAPALDPVSRMALVEVLLDADPAWRIGDFVRGRFAGPERQGLTLPATAVQTADGLSRVFLVGADGRARAQVVRLGQRLPDGQVEIVDGLPAQATVVADGLALVRDGALIRVVP